MTYTDFFCKSTVVRQGYGENDYYCMNAKLKNSKDTGCLEVEGLLNGSKLSIYISSRCNTSSGPLPLLLYMI